MADKELGAIKNDLKSSTMDTIYDLTDKALSLYHIMGGDGLELINEMLTEMVADQTTRNVAGATSGIVNNETVHQYQSNLVNAADPLKVEPNKVAEIVTKVNNMQCNCPKCQKEREEAAEASPWKL